MLTKTTYILLLGSVMLSISCFQDENIIQGEIVNADGVVVQKQELWKTSLSTKNNNVGNFNGSPSFGNIVTTSATEESAADWFMIGLDVNTGEEAWRWHDPYLLDIWFNVSQSKGEILIHKERNTENQAGSFFYAIDMSSGTTLWTDVRGKPNSSGISIMGDYYYFHLLDKMGSSYHSIPVIYKGDLHSSSYDSITIPAIDSTRLSFGNDYGLISGLTPFRGENGNDYLLIPFSEFQVEEGTSNLWTWGHLYVGLYDLTEKKYVYTKRQIAKNANSMFRTQGAELYDDRIALFNANYKIYGVDLYTGDILWEKYYDQGAFSYLLVDSILVISQTIGSDTYTYGLDPESGTTEWSFPSGGGASEMKELNGVVYWKDRGDAKLYAVDALTGELLWRLNDPDPESNSWWKSDSVGIMEGKNGEKGKIFATTHLRMYCYEAAR